MFIVEITKPEECQKGRKCQKLAHIFIPHGPFEGCASDCAGHPNSIKFVKRFQCIILVYSVSGSSWLFSIPLSDGWHIHEVINNYSLDSHLSKVDIKINVLGNQFLLSALVFCVVFCRSLFVLFGLCVVCSSSIYGFWLPLWYLLTFLKGHSDISSHMLTVSFLYF
jgi:hypothetical protein